MQILQILSKNMSTVHICVKCILWNLILNYLKKETENRIIRIRMMEHTINNYDVIIYEVVAFKNCYRKG